MLTFLPYSFLFDYDRILSIFFFFSKWLRISSKYDIPLPLNTLMYSSFFWYVIFKDKFYRSIVDLQLYGSFCLRQSESDIHTLFFFFIVLFEPGVKGEILQGSKMHHRGWLPLPGPWLQPASCSLQPLGDPKGYSYLEALAPPCLSPWNAVPIPVWGKGLILCVRVLLCPATRRSITPPCSVLVPHLHHLKVPYSSACILLPH